MSNRFSVGDIASHNGRTVIVVAEDGPYLLVDEDWAERNAVALHEDQLVEYVPTFGIDKEHDLKRLAVKALRGGKKRRSLALLALRLLAVYQNTSSDEKRLEDATAALQDEGRALDEAVRELEELRAVQMVVVREMQTISDMVKPYALNGDTVSSAVRRMAARLETKVAAQDVAVTSEAIADELVIAGASPEQVYTVEEFREAAHDQLCPKVELSPTAARVADWLRENGPQRGEQVRKALGLGSSDWARVKGELVAAKAVLVSGERRAAVYSVR